MAECIENIDIGGPTMVRAAAKNHERVSIVVNASDYSTIINSLPVGPSPRRKLLALKAYSHTATYDTMIAEWLQGELLTGKEGVTTLKYGCNPQQKPASVRGFSPQGPMPMPFDVLGMPGYINLSTPSTRGSWSRSSRRRPTCPPPPRSSTSTMAVYAPLDDDMLAVYEATGKQLSQTAIAYVRARQADPLCSFGDFIAISGVVDMSTANLIKISPDGIIAGGFEPGAPDFFKAKKGGKYIVLQADLSYEPPLEEERVVFGTTFRQTRAAEHIGSTLDNVVTADKNLTPEARSPRRADRHQVHAVQLSRIRQGRPDGRCRRRPAVAWTASSSPGARWRRGTCASTPRCARSSSRRASSGRSASTAECATSRATCRRPSSRCGSRCSTRSQRC